MSGIKDQDNIDELRKRLYDRGWEKEGQKRHSLSRPNIEVARGWDEIKKVDSIKPAPQKTETVPEQKVNQAPEIVDTVSPRLPDPADVEIKPLPKKRRYRAYILLASLGVFLLAVMGSAVYLLFGGNNISASNINISMEAPFAVAGGDTVPLQVSITNQNSVPIESATLILNYPSGTKSIEEGNRDLYEERMPIDDIESGGVVNIPIKVLLYGEENEDKEIKAEIEYRVRNSNGTYFKEANPVLIKINTSPLVLRTESIDKISSGQEMEVTLTLISNAVNPMNNVLITATYPNSFSFISAEPQADYANSTWFLKEVLPDNVYEIKFRGLVTGLADEQSEIQFKAGTPKSDNQYELSSVLTQSKTSYLIERPFIDVGVSINGDDDGKAIIKAGEQAGVTVDVVNTMNETIYDMRVELAPTGNLIRDDKLKITSGFYDSVSKKINWEIAGMSSLEQVRPGEKRTFAFSVFPDIGQSTGSFDVSVKVFARRVNEPSANERLIGTALAEAKYSSEIKFASEVNHTTNPFSDSGPVPPVAGTPTDYTITLMATAGVNDISGGVMTTSLPQYVNWTNKTEGEGAIEFNPVSKQIRWEVGSISAKESKQMKIQVNLLPSVTHIGRTLVLLESQNFRATDRFTNVELVANKGSLNNQLSEELGFSEKNGVVQSN